jgi:hypothetical protein
VADCRRILLPSSSLDIVVIGNTRLRMQKPFGCFDTHLPVSLRRRRCTVLPEEEVSQLWPYLLVSSHRSSLRHTAAPAPHSYRPARPGLRCSTKQLVPRSIFELADTLLGKNQNRAEPFRTCSRRAFSKPRLQTEHCHKKMRLRAPLIFGSHISCQFPSTPPSCTAQLNPNPSIQNPHSAQLHSLRHHPL